MKSKYCPECQVSFKVETEEDTIAFFPVLYCPFCGVDLDEDEEVEELDFDENEDE